MWKEFKDFAFKGNVVDLAVGVVIGGAFGKIVAALVANLIMPLVGLVMPGGDWRKAELLIPGPSGEAHLTYGELVGATIDFLIVAFVLFLVIRVINRMTKEKPAAPAAPTTRECPKCIEQVPLQASRCKFCTSELTPAG